MNRAHADYAQRKTQHDNALNAWRSAKNEVRALKDIQQTAMNNARRQTNGAARARPPRRGQPAINPQRRVASQRRGASMVQNPRQIFQPGGQMAIRDPIATIAQPIGNAANFPSINGSNQQNQALGNINLGQNPYSSVSDNVFATQGYTLAPPPANNAQSIYAAGPIRQNAYEAPNSPL